MIYFVRALLRKLKDIECRMTVGFAHCFFEQSGTFRDEFTRLGIKSRDYEFVNCEPAGNRSIQYDKPVKYVNNQTIVNRSMI